MSTTSYDEVPYRGFPRPHSHPDHLAAEARVFGLESPPVENARILEIGCGDGANLISIAATLPDATCVGIDASETHVKLGTELIGGAGLKNVELKEQDFTKFKSSKPFDYIIAHGVYSWVSSENQKKLLAVIQKNLAPEGIAFVSYNVFPGWNLRKLVRDLMMYRSREVEDPQERIQMVWQILPVLAQAVPQSMQGYLGLLQDEQNLINSTDDYYLFHEHLEEANLPCYFHEFADQLTEADLQFVCEAELSSMFINRYPAALASLSTESGGAIEAEQLLDFAVLRMFRQSVITHAEREITRSIDPASVTNLYANAFGQFAADLELDNTPQSFQSPSGANVTTSSALAKAAMVVLSEEWPGRVSLEELGQKAQEKLAGQETVAIPADALQTALNSITELVLAGATTNMIDLRTSKGRFVSTVSEKPVASELARHQATLAPTVFTLLHSHVQLDVIARHLLPLLDGSQDVTSLTESVLQLVADGTVVLQESGQVISSDEDLKRAAEDQVRNRLENMARTGLLIA